MPPRKSKSASAQQVDVGSTPFASKTTRAGVVRPAIPIKPSVAYGSPGRIALPKKIDRTLQKKSISQAIDDALAVSKKPELPKLGPVQDEEEEPTQRTGKKVADAEESESEEEEVQEDEESENSDSTPPSDNDDTHSILSFNTERVVGGGGRIIHNPPTSPTKVQTSPPRKVLDDLDEVSEEGSEENSDKEPEEDSEEDSEEETKELSSERSVEESEEEHVLYQRHRQLANDVPNESRGFLSIILDWCYAPFSKFLGATEYMGEFVRRALVWAVVITGLWLIMSGGAAKLEHYAVRSAENPMEHDSSLLKHYKDTISEKLGKVESRLNTVEGTHRTFTNQLSRLVRPEENIVPRRINFFAKGADAYIDPYLTSPTRNRQVIPSYFDSIKLFSPPINQGLGPDSVLQPWDDVGDCWCSSEDRGKLQLGVTLSHAVIPKVLVVENIAKEGSLHPRAAPKEIEAWIQILDPDKRQHVAAAALTYLAPKSTEDARSSEDDDSSVSQEVFGTRLALDYTWVRIGTWEYNLFAKDNVQEFHIPVPLDAFHAPAEKFVFRVLSSWGEPFTCLYRLKLHGLLASAKGEQQTEL